MKTLVFLLLLSCTASAQIKFEYVGYVWCDTLNYRPRGDVDNWGDLLDKKVKGLKDAKFKKDGVESDLGWFPEQLIVPAGWYYMAIVDGYPALFDDKGKYVEPEMLCVKYNVKDKTKEKLKDANRYNYFRPSDDDLKEAEKLLQDYLKEKSK